MTGDEVSALTLAREEEQILLDSGAAGYENPAYRTEAFQQFNQLIVQALQDHNNLNNIETYLSSRCSADPSFQYRHATAYDGTVTGYV